MTNGAARIRAAVLGAGAVGCYYGGMLARAGHDVMLIGRPVHVEAIRAHGLRFEAHGRDEPVRAAASTAAADVAGARLVLFCVKSTDTEAAAAQIAPHLGTDSVVLNLQNGVDNTERIAAAIGRPVVPAAVYVATEMAGPGHLKHHGRGDLVIGALDQPVPAPLAAALEWLQALFGAVGVEVRVSDNVAGALWEKLTVNCAYNAVSALGRAPYGRMVEVPGVRETMRAAVDEVLAVAAACGVRMSEDLPAKVARIAQAMPGQYSSTAQDLVRGRRTEIDHLNGFVVRRGDALGIPVPVNRALWALVRLAEAGRDAPPD